ncbi:MAG: hypothetical protein QM535_11725 [Limnohabitans sp.]|nr:hypothetical protein [Limnohabitans sp.]
MFYISGERSKIIMEGQLKNISCPYCNDTNCKYKVYGIYSHFFWIPMLPSKREVVYECSHCRSLYNENLATSEMKKAIEFEYQNLGKPKYPLWMYIGGSIFIPLVLWIVFCFVKIYIEDKNEEKVFIESPQANDVYFMKSPKTEDFETLLKVQSVKNDSVFVRFNNYEFEKGLGSFKYEDEKYYSKDVFGITKKRLKELYEKDSITNIRRKK